MHMQLAVFLQSIKESGSGMALPLVAEAVPSMLVCAQTAPSPARAGPAPPLVPLLPLPRPEPLQLCCNLAEPALKMALLLNFALRSSTHLTCMLSLACHTDAMTTHEQARQQAFAYQHCLHAKQMLPATALIALPVATSLRQQQGQGRVACKHVVQWRCEEVCLGDSGVHIVGGCVRVSSHFHQDVSLGLQQHLSHRLCHLHPTASLACCLAQAGCFAQACCFAQAEL